MNHLGIDEDEELQKAIMESMGKKPPSNSSLPKEFEVEDVMSQSFYHDVDFEKQKARME